MGPIYSLPGMPCGKPLKNLNPYQRHTSEKWPMWFSLFASLRLEGSSTIVHRRGFALAGGAKSVIAGERCNKMGTSRACSTFYKRNLPPTQSVFFIDLNLHEVSHQKVGIWEYQILSGARGVGTRSQHSGSTSVPNDNYL